VAVAAALLNARVHRARRLHARQRDGLVRVRVRVRVGVRLRLRLRLRVRVRVRLTLTCVHVGHCGRPRSACSMVDRLNVQLIAAEWHGMRTTASPSSPSGENMIGSSAPSSHSPGRSTLQPVRRASSGVSSCCTAWKWRVASDGQSEAAAAAAAAAAWPEAAAVRQRMDRTTPVFTLRCVPTPPPSAPPDHSTQYGLALRCDSTKIMVVWRFAACAALSCPAAHGSYAFHEPSFSCHSHTAA